MAWGMHGRGACVARVGMHGGGHARGVWWGACVTGGMAGCMQGGVCGRGDAWQGACMAHMPPYEQNDRQV